MNDRTLKIVALVAVLAALAIGAAWKIAASRNPGPRPGVDIPLRGM